MIGKAIMIQGTTSKVGKTFVTEGICRALAREGWKTAPFKIQSGFSNRFMAEEDMENGRELQKAFRVLSARYDRIVIEGAGSPVEAGLANMGMAKITDAPVLLVADIEREGAFAAVYGTIKLLPTDQQKRIKGIIFNKFQGDKELLKPSFSMIENLTGIPVIGAIPMAEHDMKEEADKLADLILESIDMDFVRELFDYDEYANLPDECRSCSAVGCGGKKDSDEGMGRVHVYYGAGKGKTSTSLGVALRCAGAGYKILIHQFISTNTSSEVEPLAGIANITRVPGIPLKRFTFMMSEEEKEEVKAQNDKKLDELMELAKAYDMLILDEIVYAVEMNLLTEEKLIEHLIHKPCQLEIVLTGRTPSEKLLDIADYASEIVKVKHPFDFGLSSRLGIEK